MRHTRSAMHSLPVSCAGAALLVAALAGAPRAGEGPQVRYRVRLVGAEGDEAREPAHVGAAEVFPGGIPAARCVVQVRTADGAPVRHRVLWRATGEPLKVQFDTSSGAEAYEVLLSEGTPPASSGWRPRAGLVLETRAYPGGTARNWDEALALWQQAARPLGRSLVDKIWHGIHPHGPTEALIAGYQGAFVAPKTGTYLFAAVSDDASFLRVDGELVAAWPGWHSVWRGRRGEHRGKKHLAEGVHVIEYVNVQRDQNFCAVAAWRVPGEKNLEVIPAEAFVPVARFQVRDAAGGPYFGWKLARHVRADGHALVRARFLAAQDGAGDGGAWIWRFDDGAQARGRACAHLFLRPGLRTVTLTRARADREAEELTCAVHVHPVWPQRVDLDEDALAQEREALRARDLGKAPVADLAYLVRFAHAAEDHAILDHAGAACLARAQDFSGEAAQVFLLLAFHYQDPEVRAYDRAEAAFRAALANLSEDSPPAHRARLHLAGLYIHCWTDAAAGLELLERVDPERLSDADRRLRHIYEADARLTRGEVDAARRLYTQAGTVVAREDLEYAAKRRARLEAAKHYVDTGAYDKAEEIIRAVEWETPLERLGTETGRIMVRVHLGREEHRFARAHCRRLLQAAQTDRDRAEILFRLAEAEFALGARDAAAEALGRLLDAYPYSEAAARAKDRWAAQLAAQEAGP